ncbi:MAG: acyltransferase [Bacteroidales bacterium]|nr:acyltransferase [Melioribacteraceae bacterium]MCF8398616.1 acyltransferase [Bacteroidales bacterium]
MSKSIIEKPRIVFFLDRLGIIFFWLRWVYPKSKGIGFAYLLYVFLPQKILRINGKAKWPMHFTSRVICPNNVELGNHSAPGLNSCCYIQAKNKIRIGHNFRMGPGVGLISANHDSSNYDVWKIDEPIIIGDNVWLGMNTVVLPGIKIGDNVIVAANSVVTMSIPSNVVAGGNPCRIIKQKQPYKGFDYSRL